MLSKFVHNLIEAKTATEIARYYFRAIRGLGFENAIYMICPAVADNSATLFSTLPDEQLAACRDDLCAAGWARWGLAQSGAMPLQTLIGTGKAGRDREFLVQHGMLTAQIIGLSDSVTRQHGVLLLNPFAGASMQDLTQRWAKAQRDITSHSWLLHQRVAAMLNHAPRHDLTLRQREVLSWVAAGKTASEIAIILGLTRATVEKHMRLARESLGANSTAQAVLQAHLSSQLYLGEDRPPYP